MTVLIDTPRWPAHGTLWAHLVSDTSLAELHAFAQSAGLSRRAFDLDHYDVPAERYAQLVATGAVPASRRALLAALTAAGLRVPSRDRPGAKRSALLDRWNALLPNAQVAGLELLDRWHEPHRNYHGPEHLTHTLDSLAVLHGHTVPDRTVPLAVWFHDAVHDGVARADEVASAQLAERLLSPLAAGLSRDEIAEIARLVLVTTDHDPAAHDSAGALISDADLAILGSAPDRYQRYTTQVRREYAAVPDAVFYPARAAVLDSLLGSGQIFRSDAGAQRWEDAAGRNLRAERARIGERLSAG